jgi:hypothetical protein
MSNHAHELLKIGLAAGLLLGILATASAADRREPQADLDSRLQEQMAVADFKPSGRPRQPFLVVLIDVTKDGAVVRDAGLELILGQPEANSATADLLVESTAGGAVVASYHVADPRFVEREDRARNVMRSAVLRVFVPLSADIDQVAITPVPGREYIVSAGGAFDPRPLMGKACEALPAADRDAFYSECNEVGAAVRAAVVR